MRRRGFITTVGGVAALASLGGLMVLGDQALPEDELVLRLRAALANLVDPRFRQRALELDQSALLASLLAKQVVSIEAGLDFERLAALAQQESLVSYQDFYYTPTELDLYSLALMVSSG